MTVAAANPVDLADVAVLEPVDSLLEVPVGNEAILWGPSPVPLHLSPSALATWWHFDGVASLEAVTRAVAEMFHETVDRVGGGVRAVAAALLDAGLLRDVAGPGTVATEIPVGDGVAPRSVSVDRQTAEWLERRARWKVALTIGAVAVGVTADTEAAAEAVRTRFADSVQRVEAPAPVRYHLVDAGSGGRGVRYWLLSDTGLPLGHSDAVEGVLEQLAAHLGEVAAVASGAGVPLRLGLLEAPDHCVAVQWDLLSCRPVLEDPLEALGYRIASRQWVVVEPAQLAAVPVAPLGGSVPGLRPLPLVGVVLWFGPGSLDQPNTLGEWVWSLVMMGCAGPDHHPNDRERVVRVAHELATNVRLVGLTDPGPSVLLAVVANVASGDRR